MSRIKPKPTLAKLTRLQLHEAIERFALFERLDRARGRKPACCIVGPPGSGKTTAAAAWLDVRAISGIWYQVDAGDADLATFFYYLGEACRVFTGKSHAPLPLLTPEYQHDVAGFSRRFFREIFSVLPKCVVVVLDNYQEVDALQNFHTLVADAMAEVPLSSMLMVVSRRDPPDCYARLVANESVEAFDWDDLRLSLDETQSIIQAHLPALSIQEIRRLHEQSEGWAAGLILMLEDYRKSRGAVIGMPLERESIFAYFVAQLFQPTQEPPGFGWQGRECGGVGDDMDGSVFRLRRLGREPISSHACGRAFARGGVRFVRRALHRL